MPIHFTIDDMQMAEDLMPTGVATPTVFVNGIDTPPTLQDIEQRIQNILNKKDNIDSKIAAAEDIISKNGVYIATTHKWLSGGFDSMVNKYGSYDVAIIDEASQVIVPNAIGALRLAEKFILVGDHRQLPPVVQSE